jgi:hypothetical protein
MSKFFDDVAAEIKRLRTQGAMESANALFNGSAFVPYGPGQYTPTPEMEQGNKGEEVAEPQRENDGMER